MNKEIQLLVSIGYVDEETNEVDYTTTYIPRFENIEITVPSDININLSNITKLTKDAWFDMDFTVLGWSIIDNTKGKDL